MIELRCTDYNQDIHKYSDYFDEFSIGTVRGTYWVKTDDCYPERIVEYNDLNWC